MNQIMDNLGKGNLNDVGFVNSKNTKDGYLAYGKIGNNSAFEIKESEKAFDTSKVGYKYAPMTGEDKKTEEKFDQFAEYMRSRQEKTAEERSEKEAKLREEKEDAKEIRQNLSSEEIKRLRMMGIDIQSANMSDLMGIINTMRGNASREEAAAMMAEIMVDKDSANVTVAGSKVVVGSTKVELKNVNISDVVADKISEDKDLTSGSGEGAKISNDDFIFLAKNELKITKEMLYKAHYSGSKAASGVIDDSEMEKMKPQIEKIISQAGMDVNKESMDIAKLLLDNRVPVTTDNLKKYVDFQSVVGKEIEEADLTSIQENNTEEKARELFDTVNSIEPEVAYEMTLSQREVTVASMKAYMQSNDLYGKNDISENSQNKAKIKDLKGEREKIAANPDLEEKAITARRQMEEIRLTMTLEVAKRVTSLDVNIDTRELARVVNALKNAERQFIKEQFVSNGAVPTEEDVNIYQEMSQKVAELKTAPAAVIALPIKGVEFTVNGLHEGMKSKTFEAIKNSYEAVETVPRRDMGDSIEKAFRNVDDLLNELDIKVDEESTRAARILGYNQIEITQENIDKVILYDREVNDLITGFYPEAVIGIIKDGINPLDVSIDELNKILREKNYNEGVSDAENFATYLRDIEHQGEITPEERESYIGLYRIMNQLAKKGDREAGWIFANGSRLTIRNLIAGMRSMKNSGMDVSIDDNFGMLTSATKSKKGIDEQIESAFKEDHEEIVENLEHYISQESDVIKFMQENGIEQTMVNSFAAEAMAKGDGIYDMIAKIMSKLKFDTNTKEEMIDEATGEITDSLSGEEKAIDFSLETFLEQLGNEGKLSLTYDDIKNQLLEMMYSAGTVTTLSREEITSVKTACAGLNILSNMARNNKYQIPLETEDGIKVMNLEIKHGENVAGNISINMGNDTTGHLSATLNVTAAGEITGYIVSTESEMNYTLMEQKDTILQAAKTAGFKVDNISLGQVQEPTRNQSEQNQVTDRRLYQAAVQIIKGISSIIIKDN